ncbi:MAG: hypothetical protein HYW24_04905 [Candidatus Aenigmarchaeota archaeon]|nr:hypothetical protein [Candidatus Aenigmarchaeota archaeon]
MVLAGIVLLVPLIMTIVAFTKVISVPKFLVSPYMGIFAVVGLLVIGLVIFMVIKLRSG